MLGAIKNKSKGWVAYLIVGLLSVPFALFGIQSYIGSSNNPSIATVDGEEINATTYFSLLSKKQRQTQDQLGDSYSAEIDTAIRQTLINELIDGKLLDNYTNSSELITLTQEVRTVIQSSAIFQVDGVFSQDRYKQLLSRNGFTPISFEAEQLKTLTRDQIRRNLATSGFVSSAQKAQIKALANQEREILYIALNAGNFDNQVVVDEAQISNYYNDNQTSFISPARVKVEYVELSLSNIATVADADDATLTMLYDDEKDRFTSEEARKAQHILLKTEEEAVVLQAQIVAGADFGEMAKRHSTDITTNEKGGDLGYFERDHMVPEFNSVVFKMAIGEVSEVVKSDYGYHIIKLNNVVESVLKPFADVKSQLQALHKERIATKELYNLQAELASLAYEEPIDAVADQFGLILQTSEFFSSSSDIYDPVFVNAAHSSLVGKGENSDVLEIGTKFVVLSLVDQQSERVKTLDQVRPEIHKTLKTIEAKAIINELVERLVGAFSSGDESLSDDIMSKNKLSWIEVGWIKRSANLPFGVAIKAYKMTKPTSGASSFASANYDNFTTVLVQLKALRQSENGDIANIEALYASEELNEWFASFVKSLRQSADIKIFSDFL
jgi:peptidyl-prolyl cis-trans isomerase D